jgi:uncharacterized membrane protein YbhN (UPF0104 family)
MIDIGTTGVLIAIGGFLARDALPGWGANVVGVAVLVGGLAAMLAVPAISRRPLERWPRRLRRPIGRALVALRYLSRARATAATAVLISLVLQSGFVLMNAWIGRSIGITIPLAIWFFVWPLAKVAGLIPISLGGLAVRDATLGALLVPVGVPLTLGVVSSLIWQSVLIVGGLLGGLLWWGMTRRLGPRSPRLRELALAASAKHHG